jgi:hypothetical protein
MFGMNGNSSDGSLPVGNDLPNMPTVPGPDSLLTANPTPPVPPTLQSPVPPSLAPAPSITAPTPQQPTAVPQLDDQSHESLLQLKQQALQSLAPLVGRLDQTPEERFKITMMMLQASDNPALVKEAYAAANQITDEKARAQALLDVVNEINYFTQHNAPDDTSGAAN